VVGPARPEMISELCRGESARKPLYRHGTYQKATKGREKGENFPPRVAQSRTTCAQTTSQIQTRRASLEARKITLSQGQVGRADCFIPLTNGTHAWIPFFFAADFYGFFFHAIPEGHSTVLTLPELHQLVSDVWLTRHDAELEEERAARRKGRPKSTKEQKLEEAKFREAEEYRTGMGK
jgi:translation machinery-associated protein 16